MSDPKNEHHTPLLEGSHVPHLLSRGSSRARTTIMVVMSTQTALCGFLWAFVGVLAVKKAIPLPDNLAIWTHENPSETNMLITIVSTVLGVVGSFLLGVTAQHALRFRLSHQVRLSVVTTWIQFARNSLFFRPRRHLRWTLLSGLWVCVIHFLTIAWSNLLTPEPVVQRFTGTRLELDLLKPAVANYTYYQAKLPPIYPTTGSYFLIPWNTSITTSMMDDILRAGSSAAMAFINITYPSFSLGFKSSTGGVLPQNFVTSSFDFRGPGNSHKGLSTTYTSVQQGYTANISCVMSSSPTIALNNTASVKHIFEVPSLGLRVNYTLQTWSWSTNCSGHAKRYTGEVNIIAGNHTHGGRFVATGLLAASVCFYQKFSGPSNQSFLILMQSTSDSGYNGSYSVAENNLLTVCQVTPMVTTVKVEYDSNWIGNIVNVLEQAQVPDVSWPLVLFPGLKLWESYLLAQGPYANSMGDSILGTGLPDIMPILENYLRGIVEYLGTKERHRLTDSLALSGQALPDNMTILASDTMNVHTVGWKFHQRTHGIALAAVTLLTTMTIASGAFALTEANRQKSTGNVPQKRTTTVLDPMDLMDVLVASSMGSLANALSQCDGEKDRENLRVEFAVTDNGQPVLNAR